MLKSKKQAKQEPKPKKAKAASKRAKKPKPEKEPEFLTSQTNMRTVNYRVYYLSKKERIGYFLMAFAVGALVGYIFYGGLARDAYGDPTLTTYVLNTLIGVGTGLIAAKLYMPVIEQKLLVGRQERLKRQFRDMLESLSASFGTGKNIRDAFYAAQQDMMSQYEEDAMIVQELQVINGGLANGIVIEELLKDLGARSGSEDIMDFAAVFEVGYRKGINTDQLVRNTYTILSDKMAIAQEIETTVTASKNEQYAMLVLPVALVGVIKLSSPDMAANFATIAGVLASTVSIGLFVAAYFLGKRILNIKM